MNTAVNIIVIVATLMLVIAPMIGAKMAYDGFYVMSDINNRHYFDSLGSPADEIGFKSLDYWELVE